MNKNEPNPNPLAFAVVVSLAIILLILSNNSYGDALIFFIGCFLCYGLGYNSSKFKGQSKNGK
jgi:hypothetical protein